MKATLNITTTLQTVGTRLTPAGLFASYPWLAICALRNRLGAAAPASWVTAINTANKPDALVSDLASSAVAGFAFVRSDTGAQIPFRATAVTCNHYFKVTSLDAAAPLSKFMATGATAQVLTPSTNPGMIGPIVIPIKDYPALSISGIAANGVDQTVNSLFSAGVNSFGEFSEVPNLSIKFARTGPSRLQVTHVAIDPFGTPAYSLASLAWKSEYMIDNNDLTASIFGFNDTDVFFNGVVELMQITVDLDDSLFTNLGGARIYAILPASFDAAQNNTTNLQIYAAASDLTSNSYATPLINVASRTAGRVLSVAVDGISNVPRAASTLVNHALNVTRAPDSIGNFGLGSQLALNANSALPVLPGAFTF